MSQPDPQLWQRAAAMFDELVELDGDARKARLQVLEDTDPQLALAVQSLLMADEQTGGMLDRGVAYMAPTVVEGLTGVADFGDESGSTIGAFRLLRLLGRGGMGEVYLAERSVGDMRQLVAIKLLKRGMDSAALLRRFAQERRILAQLSHPHIARFLDGGMSSDGRPYFAMEYVDGSDIVEHARARELSARACVSLIASVCDAVAYAHSRLVVHRDLKPSNMLIDVNQQPRVLDFGIAKLLTDSEDGTLTATDVRVMSPAYAAPEQILGEAIGTATDVYALGVVLFELLTGVLPHRRSRNSAEALVRGLEVESIERPSVVARNPRSGDQGGPDAQARTQRMRLARELESDLDTIVLTALQREPERRYSSAAALADDLRRWLDGRPIAARPDTAAYRFSKFVRRHRGAVAASLLTLVALIGGLAVALWQAGIAREQALRAETQAARAERVKDFVLTLFREQDPLIREKAKAATAGELIARGIATAQRDFSTDPALEAEVVGDLALLQFSLGDVKEARANFERVLTQRRALDGEDSIAYGVALANLGGAQLALGEREKAGPSIERAVEILRRRAGPDAIETAEAEVRLQRVLVERGKNVESLELARHVLVVYTRERGATHPETLRRRYNVGVVLEQLDRLDEAETEFRAIIEAHTASGSPDHVQLVYPRTLLGDVLRRKRSYPEAAVVYQQALEVARRELGDKHRTVGHIAFRQGDLLRRLRRYVESEAAFAEAERVFEPLGAPELGQVYTSRGQLLRQQEKYADAIIWYERSVAHFGKTIGANTSFTLSAELLMAVARADAGDIAQAVADAERSAAALRASTNPGSSEDVFAGEGLGYVLALAGRHTEALEQHRLARKMQVAIYDAEHMGVATLDVAIAKDLMALGQELPEARTILDRAIELLRIADPTGPDFGQALLTSAKLARRDGDEARAIREYGEALLVLETAYGPDHALSRAARMGTEQR